MSEALASPPPFPWLDHRPDGHPVDPGLGGPLLLSPGVPPGGTVLVATDALLAHAEKLSALRDALHADALALARLAPVLAGHLWGAPALVGRAAQEVQVATMLTRAAAQAAVEADRDLRTAIERYAQVEDEARQHLQLLGAALAVMLGPAIRVLITLGLPVALGAHLAGYPTATELQQLRDWMLAHPEVITSPEFVEAVRATVMSVDDATGSIAGLPPGLVQALGEALGFPGIEAGAAIVMGVGMPFGLFRDGPVFVQRVSTSATTSGPTGAVERLARVPEGDQVRVERYDAPGKPPRYIVYVGPTETFSPVARTEPWDLTSNVAGVGGLEGGSLRASEQAMRDAGVEPGDEVQFVGFSQGGLVAARLAASGDWNAVGIETYGAPSGNVELPPGLHGMAVRNSDDFVPALAGPQLDHSVLLVERRAFEQGSPIPTELPAPAHQRSAYVATATVIDQATSAAVRDQLAALDAFTTDYTDRDGSRVTVMMYHAERGVLKQM